MEAGADVQFDFAGSLQLARKLCALADQIDTLMVNRVTAAEAALTTWSGGHGSDFAGRVGVEADDIVRLAADLRSAAHGWAACWVRAMDEQNRILHAREEERVRDSRGTVDKVVGWATGHDDLPPAPEPVSTPAAPGFAATATLVRY